MVFVKVRETYDLHTIKNKMSIIGIHTPGSGIIKKNYPGLLMQCKAYRPVSCDVRLACASMLPLDPQGVGTTEGDVAPEDVFNPILYKPMSNFGMSQLDLYINSNGSGGFGQSQSAIDGEIATADNIAGVADDFNTYYGLLAQTHEWRHASPQSGLAMSNLVPLVYETWQNIGDNVAGGAAALPTIHPNDNRGADVNPQVFRGSSHRLPFLNCTAVRLSDAKLAPVGSAAGWPTTEIPANLQLDVPSPKCFVASIIVPPSRLHQLFYRLVCEWTLEFSSIRPLGDITSFGGLAGIGDATHYMSYSFDAKSLPEETSMVDTTEGSDITKVM